MTIKSSLTPAEVSGLIKKINLHISEKARKLSRSVIKHLRGIISDLERLMRIAKRKLKKIPSLADTYKIPIPMHHAYKLSNLNLL
jgi:hypothetical protein